MVFPIDCYYCGSAAFFLKPQRDTQEFTMRLKTCSSNKAKQIKITRGDAFLAFLTRLDTF
jgi:hypothetical protein